MEEVISIHKISNLDIGEISHLNSLTQVIDDKNIAVTHIVQLGNNPASDKSSTAGHNFHFSLPLIFSITDVVE